MKSKPAPDKINLYQFNIYCSKAKKPLALAAMKHTLGFFLNPLKIHSEWDAKKKMHRVYCESEDEDLIMNIGDLAMLGSKT